MAVYKPSNCTPFLTCLDLTKAQDITCELNTSNELVTGYKIKILDNNNDVIFEGKKFDPINPDGYENSGLNGSTLTLPLIVEGAAINNNTIGYQNGEYNIKDPTSAEFDATRFSNGYINQPYKWEIILEQGNTTGVKADKYYDMTITQGKVLGSTKNRIQSYLSENIYKDYFIKLDNVPNRVLISSYDHTYGYLYPQENKFTDRDIEKASYFEIYKFSNDPNVIASGSQVAFATQNSMNEVTIGGKISSITWGSKLVYPYYFEQVFKGLSRSYAAQNDIPNSAFDPEMNGFLVTGTNIMVKGETDANAFNGIFTLNSISEKERDVKVNGETKTLYDLTLKWLRSTPGNTWANLTNAVFYVQNGTDHGTRWQVDTDAQTVGTINQTPVEFIREKPVEIYTDPTKGYEGNSKTQGKIFKNTESQAYIRPFAGVSDGMRFSYLKKDSVQYQNLDIQSIDTETWAVSGNIGSILTPDVDQYKITSYFKGSDENPFYAYSNPVLSIESDQWEKNPDGSYIKIKNTEYFKGLKRYITVEGNFENRNWVNYQWFLTDLTGGHVQTSEKKYRGDTKHTFYGLETEHYYTIRWVVEDEYGIVWEQEQSFKVEVRIINTEFPFNVNFECETQSVLIDFVRNAVVVPDPQIYDYKCFMVYQTDKKGEKLINLDRVPFKVETDYEGETRYYRILDKSFVGDIYTIDYKQETSTSGYLKLSDIKDIEKFEGEQLIKYEKTKIEGDNNFSDISAPTNSDCVLNSEHILNPNFTGNIISYEIDTDDVNGQPSYICLTISSQPPWNLDKENYIPNENRNKLILTAFKDINGDKSLPSNIPIHIYKKSNDGWMKDNDDGEIWKNSVAIVSAYVDPNAKFDPSFDYIKTTYLYQDSIVNEDYRHILGDGKYNSNSGKIKNPILKYEGDTTSYTQINIWYDNYTELMEQKSGDSTSAINVFGEQWNWSDDGTWNDTNQGGAAVYSQVLDINHSGKQNINKYKITLNITIKKYNNENLNNDTAWKESVVANAFVEDEEISGGDK